MFRPKPFPRFATPLTPSRSPAIALLCVALLALPGAVSAQSTPQATAAPGPRRGGAEARARPPDTAAVNPDNNPERIIEIKVEGTRRADPDAVKGALVNKVGSIFDPAKTAEDLRAVWALNAFTDVQLLVQRLPNGIVYVVRVQERPTLREIQLEGNKEISKDDLKDQLEGLKPFSILDLAEVQKTAKKIQDKYIEKGFFLAEVTHRIDPVPNNPTAVNVVFVVREHAKVVVRQIQLLGAKKVPAGGAEGDDGHQGGQPALLPHR